MPAMVVLKVRFFPTVGFPETARRVGEPTPAHIPDEIREPVLDDLRLRDETCRFPFDCRPASPEHRVRPTTVRTRTPWRHGFFARCALLYVIITYMSRATDPATAIGAGALSFAADTGAAGGTGGSRTYHSSSSRQPTPVRVVPHPWKDPHGRGVPGRSRTRSADPPHGTLVTCRRPPGSPRRCL
jgi:hypothetical protein